MTLFARRSPLPESTGYSIIDEQLVVLGEIATEGTIRVDGRLEGRLHRVDTMIVGARGVVIGNVDAREVIVAGSIEGDVTAAARVEIQAAAAIRGDVRSAALLLHEGGIIDGHVTVAQPERAAEGARLELASNQIAGALPR